jgi:hypothetical protein
MKMAKSNMVRLTEALQTSLELIMAVQARFTLYPGMQNTSMASRALLTLGRPVVVAENMIGVAMYELVRNRMLPNYCQAHTYSGPRRT